MKNVIILIFILLPSFVSAQYFCGKCYDEKPDIIKVQFNNDSLKLVVVDVKITFFEDSISIKKFEIFSLYLRYNNDSSKLLYYNDINWNDSLMMKIKKTVNEEFSLYRCWVAPGNNNPQKKHIIYYEIIIRNANGYKLE